MAWCSCVQNGAERSHWHKLVSTSSRRGILATSLAVFSEVFVKDDDEVEALSLSVGSGFPGIGVVLFGRADRADDLARKNGSVFVVLSVLLFRVDLGDVRVAAVFWEFRVVGRVCGVCFRGAAFRFPVALLGAMVVVWTVSMSCWSSVIDVSFVCNSMTVRLRFSISAKWAAMLSSYRFCSVSYARCRFSFAFPDASIVAFASASSFRCAWVCSLYDVNAALAWLTESFNLRISMCFSSRICLCWNAAVVNWDFSSSSFQSKVRFFFQFLL